MLGRLNALRTSLFAAIPTLFRGHSELQVLGPNYASMSAAHTGSVEVATFASGCFWGTEHVFLKKFPPAQDKGILKTAVGYTGGKVVDPSYREVCGGDTEHAESVRIEFDPKKLPYETLVEYFFCTHDPTHVNRQGPDVGTQYRSAIFYHSEKQKVLAENVKADVQEKHFKGKQIATQIVPAGKWYDAEDYHQKYLINNPSGYECPTHHEHWAM